LETFSSVFGKVNCTVFYEVENGFVDFDRKLGDFSL